MPLSLVLAWVKIIVCVRNCTALHWFRSFETKGEILCNTILHIPITYSCLVSRLLWTHISPVLVSHRLAIDVKLRTAITVTIVLMRTISVERDSVKPLWHREFHTETHQLWESVAVLTHLHFFVDDNLTGRSDGIGHQQSRLGRLLLLLLLLLLLSELSTLALLPYTDTYCVFSLYDIVGSYLVGIETGHTQAWIPPCTQTPLHTGSVVVICRSTPEVRTHLKAFLHHRMALEVDVRDIAVSFVEGHIDILRLQYRKDFMFFLLYWVTTCCNQFIWLHKRIVGQHKLLFGNHLVLLE